MCGKPQPLFLTSSSSSLALPHPTIWRGGTDRVHTLLRVSLGNNDQSVRIEHEAACNHPTPWTISPNGHFGKKYNIGFQSLTYFFLNFI